MGPRSYLDRESTHAVSDQRSPSASPASSSCDLPAATVSTEQPPVKPRSSKPSRKVERCLFEQLLAQLGRPSIAARLWDGEEVQACHEPARFRMTLQDRGTLWKMLLDTEYEFAEGYVDGRIVIDDDLTEFLTEVNGSLPAVREAYGWHKLITKSRHRRSRNTLRGSRKNISHHYDIGNDFYRLWLDRQLLYTCAYFEDPSVSLERAQTDKMDHICRKLRLQAGESVVEAGCGWGAFALHMAKHYGVKVRAYNISHEQIAFARERAQAEGLQDRVEFVLDDWRAISQPADVFVSVGMLEHVGVENFPLLGEVIRGCIGDEGRGLIHSIGLNCPRPLSSWIATHIFPGAQPPSIGEMTQIFEQKKLSIWDVENLRLHYALTLRHWLRRMEEAADTVCEMFDERFLRVWRMYLASSITSFETGWLQLFQVLFAGEKMNDMPWTRKYQYNDFIEG